MTDFPKSQKVDMRYSFWRDRLYQLQVWLIKDIEVKEGAKEMSDADNNAIRDILKGLHSVEVLMLERMRDTIDDKIDVMYDETTTAKGAQTHE